MAQSNINNLVTLIKRLEAATSRLEDIATSASGTELEGATKGVPASAAATNGGAPAIASAAPAAPEQAPEPLPPAIEGFDSLINGEVKTFANLSDGIGGLVAQQAAGVLRTFAAERKFLVVTTKAKKPDISSPVYMQCLTEMQAAIGQVNELRESNRSSPLFPHLSMVSEGIPMVAWVTVDRKPQDSVTEMLNSAQFYGNRVIKEYKEKEQTHVDWVRSFYAICQSLAVYIEEFYPGGLTWNQKDGIDAAEALKQVEAGNVSSSQQPKAGGAPPPPPPPPPPAGGAPPPPPPPAPGAPKAAAGPDMGAVFADISKGEDVTKGLRKVDASQQTHKNPALRGGSTVASDPKRSNSLNSQSSGGRGKSPMPARKPDSMRTKKPPKKELDGNKWYIENYDAPQERVVEIQAEISHSILITKCHKTTFRVHGKANAISVDSSSQVGLVVDSLVSSVEVIKVPRFEMQVLGNLPTILLDQVDGASVYLSKDSLETEVFTSKCTGVNINVPGKTEDEDYKECPVPEQIKTIIRNGQAVSSIVEHAG